jgi:hypothetical protein
VCDGIEQNIMIIHSSGNNERTNIRATNKQTRQTQLITLPLTFFTITLTLYYTTHTSPFAFRFPTQIKQNNLLTRGKPILFYWAN